MSFTYRALNTARREIRLLRLRPAATMDEPLRVSLFHASLDAVPAYEALSYVWGKSWGHFPVWLEEEGEGSTKDGDDTDDHTKLPSLSITPNLDNALRHLRYRSSSSSISNSSKDGDRILWVDALCINQKDPAERSGQVQQMRHIYEACVADVAWLGPNPGPPPTLEEVDALATDDNEDESDSSVDDGASTEAVEETKEEKEARERILAVKRAEKRRILEKRRAQEHERITTRLRRGVTLMRQVAHRDMATLSAMVGHWHESSRFYNSRDDKPEVEKKAVFDPDDPNQIRLMEYWQVDSLYTTFSTAHLWSRVWIVQELSCAPQVLLAVSQREAGEDKGEDQEKREDNRQWKDSVDTLDWDKDVMVGFLDDAAYSDAFHSMWGHGFIGPAAASIFSRVRAIQLQRQMLRGQRAASQASQGFHGIVKLPFRGRPMKEQLALEDEMWKGDEETADAQVGPMHNDPSLINVLARFKWTRSTDPRDKVYGLLGLVAEAPLLPAVDYTKSTDRVFGDAALAIIQTSGCLDVISQNPFDGEDGPNPNDYGKGGTGSSPHVPNLPSWVPNFDRSMYTDHYDEFATILFAQRGIYAAGKPDCRHLLPLNVEEAPDSQHLLPLDVEDGWVKVGDGQHRPIRSLRLRGTVLGRVAPLKQGPWEELGLEYIGMPRCLDMLRKFKALFCGAEEGQKTGEKQGKDEKEEKEEKPETQVYAATGEPLWDAFWRTVVGDCAAYPIRRISAGEERAKISADLAEALRLRDDELRQEEEETRNFTTEKELSDYHTAKGDAFYQPASQLLHGMPIVRMLTRMVRRWGMAQTMPDSSKHHGGSLLLMVRSAVQAGDVVAVLDGSKVPVVLRAQDVVVVKGDGALAGGAVADSDANDATTYYEYICPAYVHGYMDGEAVAQVADGRLVEQDLVLM